MANRIVLKRTATAGLAPSAAELAAGELALNIADGSLYTRLSSGTVLQLVPPGGLAAASHTHDATDIVGATLAIARGGTGVSTAPSPLQVLVGQSGGVYGLRTLTAGNNVSIVDNGTELTLTATAGGEFAETARTVTTITATAGQTVLVTSAAYTSGAVDVFVNGVLLTPGTDYDAVGGTTITMVSPLTVNDTVQVVSYSPMSAVTEVKVAVLRTSAAATLISGTYTQRLIDTEVYDPTGLVTLSNGEFSLPSGTYLAWIVCTMRADGGNEQVVEYASRLRNVSDAVTVLESTGGRLTVTSTHTPTAQESLIGSFVVSGTKAFALQTYSLDSVASNNTTYGNATIIVMKVA